jgi:hypothetical protein
MPSKQSANKEVIEYRKTMKNVLTTTRFNNKTWSENQQFRDIHSKIGCIYPTPEPNRQEISPETNLFVLEMNNETNQIIGVGLVKNKPIYNKYHVYSDPKYNSFAYLGKHRIDRKSMDKEEERIMKVFDILCFKGFRHMKRLLGLKTFPVDILYKCKQIMDLLEFVSSMFKKRMIEPVISKDIL